MAQHASAVSIPFINPAVAVDGRIITLEVSKTKKHSSNAFAQDIQTHTSPFTF
jgi:hypothetical protein